MTPVRVNRWLDFLDRVAWTFLETLPAMLGADAVWDRSIPWSVKLGVPATAAFLAAIKVSVAQRQGDDNLGSAVPGDVLEPVTLARPESTR